MTPEHADKRERTQALINIAVFEALLLAGVIAIFAKTGSFTYLIAGIVGVMIITLPMFLRWSRSPRARTQNKNG